MDGATVEAGEPSPYASVGGPWRGTKQSIWWSWQAPARGAVEIDTGGSEFFPRVLAVYSGTNLVEVSLVALSFGDVPLALNVSPGEVYQIAVLSDEIQTGRVTLAIDFFTPPANDEWKNAAVISGKELLFQGSLRGATTEPAEQLGPVDHTVWWRWTAPGSGQLRFHETQSTSYGLQAFQGATLETLTMVSPSVVKAGETYFFRISAANEPSQYEFGGFLDTTRLLIVPANVLAGQPFEVRLEPDPDLALPQEVTFAGLGPEIDLSGPPWSIQLEGQVAGDFNLRAEVKDASGSTRSYDLFASFSHPNDRFADALPVPEDGGSFTVEGSVNSTFETGEPAAPENSGDILGTLWWGWRAAYPGVARIFAENPFVLFQGTNLNQLSRVAPLLHKETTSGIESMYRVEAGHEYRVQLLGRASLHRTRTEIEIGIWPAQDNDSFEDRAILPTPATIPVDLRGATFEPGEPALNNSFSIGGRSLWWSYTATQPGELRLDLIDPIGQVEGILREAFVLGVYKGENLSALSPLPDGSREYSQFLADLAAGESIHVRVAVSSEAADAAFLRTSFRPLVNDVFRNSTRISTLPFLEKTTFRRASQEPAEPGTVSGGPYQTRWWTWTATFTGELSCALDRVGLLTRPPFPEVPLQRWINVYTGSELTQLKPAGTTNVWGNVLLHAAEGETYHFQAVGRDGGEALIYIAAPEPNDDVENAMQLTASSGTLLGTLYQATHEPGESNTIPAYGGTPLTGSLWWKWRGPADGVLKLNGAPAEFYHLDSSGSLVPRPPIGTENNGTFNYYAMSSNEIYYAKLDAALASTIPLDDVRNVGLDYSFSAFQIESPRAGAQFAEGDSVALSIRSTDVSIDGALLRGQLILRRDWGDSRVFDFDSLPFRTVLTNLAPGDYTIDQARGVSDSGKVLTCPAVRFTVTPSNDLFIARHTLTGDTPLPPTGSTLESFETNLFPGASGSVWYEWKAPESEYVQLRGPGYLAVFTGTISTNLLPVLPPTFGGAIFQVEQDRTYQIAAIQKEAPVFGDEMSIIRAPTNDSFHSATPMDLKEGSTLHLHPAPALTTLEEGEPRSSDEIGSQWWQGTTQFDTLLRIRANVRFGVFEGEGLSSLRPVFFSLSPDGMWRGRISQGRPFRIRVAAFDRVPETKSLNIEVLRFSANDPFEQALELAGAHVMIEGSNADATIDSFEPPGPEGHPVFKSVWYHWTAPREAAVHLSLENSRQIEVFQGSEVFFLSRVPFLSAPELYDGTNVFTFLARAGERYSFRVSSEYEFLHGSFKLSLDQASAWPLPNQTLDTRTGLLGPTLSLSGDNAGALVEDGDTRGGSLWWSWTAAEDGVLRILVTNAPVLFYRATDLSAPVRLGAHGTAITVSKGEEIVIMVYRQVPRSFAVTIELVEPLPNTEPEHAFELQGAAPYIFADVSRAPGLLGAADWEYSTSALFWEWTPPLGGRLRIHTNAVEARIYGVYPGQRIVAGRTYSVAVRAASPVTIQLQVEPPEIQVALGFENGQALLEVSAYPEALIRIERSDDLVNWIPLQTVHTTGAPVIAPDPSAPHQHQFYRFVPLAE